MLREYEYKFLECIIQNLPFDLRWNFGNSSDKLFRAIDAYHASHHWGPGSFRFFKYLPEYKSLIDGGMESVPLFIAKFSTHTDTQSESYILMPIYQTIVNDDPRFVVGIYNDVVRNEFDKINKAVHMWFDISFNDCQSLSDSNSSLLSESCCVFLVGEFQQ